MTRKEFKTMLDTLEIPTAYYQFPNGTAVDPPYICFYLTYSNDLVADDTNYQRIDHMVVELYTRTKDFEQEGNLETLLNQNGLVFAKTQEFLDDEQLFVAVYDTDSVITEEINNAGQ